jgi:lipopolysaccharide biosynthesis protein
MIAPASPAVTGPRFIAHYLPQFHPTAENDAWWGRGFTEWTNVARARPLFRGHYQPHVPADLGFYDLRLPEARAAQADLARAHGIHGFMYYHYWFHGRRLLHRPFDDVLRSGEPDFPFCLCWANETWSRRWTGDEREVLVAQNYSAEDIRAHARWLAKPFADPRYLRVQGRPLFVIYRFAAIPREIDAVAILRDELAKAGADDPYLVAGDVHAPHFDYAAAGFDHRLAFEPALSDVQGALDARPATLGRALRNARLGVASRSLKLFGYERASAQMAAAATARGSIPCQLVAWDNSPRRGAQGVIFRDCTPENFSRALERRLHAWAASSPTTDLFFLNAWNEWAEGNHLEPDERFGLGYLDALSAVRQRVGQHHHWPDAVAPASALL